MPSAIEMIAQHIASEEKASRVYRYFQSWCGLNGWPGSEEYFRLESKDELRHMRKFQEYADDTWRTSNPPPVDAQPMVNPSITSMLDCYQAALDLERDVLNQLDAIATQAITESNHDVLRFLQPFTEIGINSIRELTTYVQQLQRAGADPAALLVFDNEIKG